MICEDANTIRSADLDMKPSWNASGTTTIRCLQPDNLQGCVDDHRQQDGDGVDILDELLAYTEYYYSPKSRSYSDIVSQTLFLLLLLINS